MLRSIYEKILGALRTNHRRKPPRRAGGARCSGGTRYSRSRRLVMESLENRTLLTVTLLTSGSISDGDFAAPALSAHNYQVAPQSSPWQFSGIAGVSANGSAFTSGNPNSPQGAQVAFIQDNASISQTVYLDAGVYNLSMLAAQRINYQTQQQEIEVLVDGAPVGLILPNSPVLVNKTSTTAYASYQTSNFTVTTGTHTVELLGLSPSTADSTAFLGEVAIAPVVDTLLDGSFETPALDVNTFQTDTGGSAWQFSGTAGVARNGSAFLTDWTEAQNAPAGTQVAYLQKYGSMSQTVFLDAGTYGLSFLAAQRAIYQASYQAVEVLVDGGQVATIDPVNTLYGTYETSTFTVATGIHTIKFLGLDPQGGDNTVFIDQVTLAANAITDGSFQTPGLVPGAYQFAPSGSPWQFSSTAGVARNGSNFIAGTPNAPGGTDVGFLEGNGNLSQTVDLIAGEYNISFDAVQRANGQTQPQTIEVLVDPGQADAQFLGLIMPVGINYHLYETSNFTVAAGMHTIQFVGVSAAGSSSTALIDEVTLAAANDEIIDGSFEAPVLAANSYQVTPSNSGWQFSGLAGISTNNSGLTSGNTNAPQGAQVAFLMNNGGMSQTIYLDANTYDLSFLAVQRVAGQSPSQPQTIEVLVDGRAVGLITPINSNYNTANTSTPISTPQYTLYQTSNFTVAAGIHTIQFLGVPSPGGASTAFIDNVSLVTVEDAFSDASFETPVLPGDSFAYTPAGTAWQFSGLAGVTTNLSAFTSGSAYTPDGAQAAFIKDTGSMSQAVYFQAGSYNISFEATQRIYPQSRWQQIEVLLDPGQADAQFLGVITPTVSTNPNLTAYNILGNYYTYTPYQTANFTATAGTHTVEFLGLAPSTADSTAFIDDVSIYQGCSLIDGSFEEPALATKAYQVAPSGAAWQFAGAAGISSNASAFTFGNPVAPDGVQVAFIKDTGSMSQSVYLAGGVYNLSFLAAQRNYDQTQGQTIEILVDGKLVGLDYPCAPPSGNGWYPAGTTFGSYTTANFTVTTGVHTIVFVGLSPSTADSTAFIDDVQLNV